MDNLIWTKPGTDPSLAPVFVTAHWDSVPMGPGANDNGSGCACLIEIARVVEALNLNFRRTVVLIMFAMEEENLAGSAYYAAHMTSHPALVLNLDMIGYTAARETLYPLSDVLLDFPSTGDFIAVLASRPAAQERQNDFRRPLPRGGSDSLASLMVWFIFFAVVLSSVRREDNQSDGQVARDTPRVKIEGSPLPGRLKL